MNPLVVELGQRSYPIHIGEGLLERADLVGANLPGQDILIVTNETVAPLYLDRLATSLAHFRLATLVLPDGENFKTLDTLNRVFDCLLAHRFSRDCTLVALGGGVIGDIVGFAAASYQRGVAFVQVPTTLLAQVDSSVGGKTGVNHPQGKNMIGAFHQPRNVVADTSTLNTLPKRELRAGLAEVIKYGLICDRSFFSWIEHNIEVLLDRDADALRYAINRCCEIKAQIVSTDEHEAGTRALLNLGHTFAHAIEKALGFGEWLHGEAVSAGLNIAAQLSNELQWIGHEEQRRIEDLLRRTGLPTTLPEGITPTQMLDLMKLDKKVMAGAVRLILLKDIGKAVISSDFDQVTLSQVLQHSARAH